MIYFFFFAWKCINLKNRKYNRKSLEVKTSIFVMLKHTHVCVCIFIKYISYFIKSKNVNEKLTQLFSH